MSKLDWMYKSSNKVEPEDYLLGKAIDKNFEAQASSRNEVDKDILPTSIFANSNSNAPVDIFRKTKEDPLEQIKQKEIEMRKQLLKNPVKLKKIQSMLKAKAEGKEHQKKKKKSKSKDIDDRLAKLLQKYGTKQVMELTTSDDSEEEEDGKSKESRRKNKRNKDRSASSASSDESRSRSRDRDRRGRKSSRDRSLKYKEKKKKVKRRRSSSASSSERGNSRKHTRLDDSRPSRDDRGRRRKPSESSDDKISDSVNRKGKSSKDKSDKAQGLMNEYMRLIEKHGAKKLMELISDDDSEDEQSEKKKKKKSKARSDPSASGRVRKSDHRKKHSADSAKRKNEQRSSSEDSSSEDGNIAKKEGPKKPNLDGPSREPSRKHKQRSSSSSSYSPDDDDGGLDDVKTKTGSRRQDAYSSDEGKSSFKKAYGLVLPKGFEAKPRSNSRPAAESSSKKDDDQKNKFVRPKPSKLTEEEKEAKLKEMMANAQWRDKERKSNVTKYREEEKREADSQKYDEGFMRKELAKAVDSSKSVEERIKSRMNNVQRSKFSMSQNFARRN